VETEAAQDLNVRASQKRSADYKSSFHLATKALLLATAAQDEGGIIASLNNLAWYSFETANYTLGISTVFEALERSILLGDGYAEADARNILAALYIAIGDYVHGVEECLKSLNYAQCCGCHTLEVRNTQQLGIYYHHTGSHSEAMRHFERALALQEKQAIPQDGYIATTLQYMGILQQEQRDYAQALACYERSIEEARRAGDVKTEALSILYSGQIRLVSGETEACFLDYSAALTMLRTDDAWNEIAYTLTQLAHACLALRQLPQADSYLRNALEINENHDLTGETIEEIYLGFVAYHRQKGDFQQALCYYERYVQQAQASLKARSATQLQTIETLYKVEQLRGEAQTYQRRSEALEAIVEHQAQVEAARIERERLEITLQKERELNHVKTMMLTRIAHEFRTPLANIQSSTELLTRYLERMTPEKREQHAWTIVQQIRHLTEMLTDVSLVARSSHHQEFHPQPLDLRTLVSDALTRLTSQEFDASRVQVHLQNLRPIVLLDDDVLHRILNNLLSNALKFSAAEEPVLLFIEDRDNHICLRVVDNGIGIPSEEQEQVFLPLYRGSNTGEIGGTGLGLTIVKNDVMTHKGDIKILNRTPQGTEIIVHLPTSAAHLLESSDMEARHVAS
jgi:signal transduction histidine kinase